MSAPPRLGIRENLGQISLLVLINAFVGAMVGMERSILPILAEREFGVASRAGILSFLVTFGIVKALANAAAGGAADRWGRRRVLLAGWAAALPVPVLISVAPSWDWVVLANVFLGVNQGLCWSAAVTMKVDLAGPRQRGLVIGLNESSGYLAVSAAALASGYLAARYGLRPQPFLIGVGAAVAGFACSLFVRETRPRAAAESALRPRSPDDPASGRAAFARVTWRDRSLRAVCQAGLVNNLNDGLSWGLFPLLFASRGASLRETAILAAVYPAVWGMGQLATGILSDRHGRKWLMAGGMVLQAAALLGVAASGGFRPWLIAMAALGFGTAMVYPTFLGAVADHSAPGWRASALGIYRFWRDLGYALGALLAGIAADRFGIPVAVALSGALTGVSGLFVALTYSEHASFGIQAPASRDLERDPAPLGPQPGGGTWRFR